MKYSKHFIDGYNAGQYYEVSISLRQAAIMRPFYSSKELDVFLNGYNDGLSNDDFRLNIAKHGHSNKVI
ncbi:MAG: hypothetical protein ACYST3_07245 [Planctomycetota bacterium]